MILILQNQNDDSKESIRIDKMILAEIDSDSRIKVMVPQNQNNDSRNDNDNSRINLTNAGINSGF